jgi:hypothetical protein
MTKTMVTFIVLLALLLAIPWTSYAGHGRNGNTSVFIRGFRYTVLSGQLDRSGSRNRPAEPVRRRRGLLNETDTIDSNAGARCFVNRCAAIPPDRRPRHARRRQVIRDVPGR